jgi:hypothetical protein
MKIHRRRQRGYCGKILMATALLFKVSNFYSFGISLWKLSSPSCKDSLSTLEPSISSLTLFFQPFSSIIFSKCSVFFPYSSSSSILRGDSFDEC